MTLLTPVVHIRLWVSSPPGSSSLCLWLLLWDRKVLLPLPLSLHGSLLLLGLKVGSECLNSLLEARYWAIKVGALVVKFCHLNLQEVTFFVLCHHLLLSHHNCILRQLVSLLKVYYEFILALNNDFVFFDLLFVRQDLVALGLSHTVHKVIKGPELDV